MSARWPRPGYAAYLRARPIAQLDSIGAAPSFVIDGYVRGHGAGLHPSDPRSVCAGRFRRLVAPRGQELGLYYRPHRAVSVGSGSPRLVDYGPRSDRRAGGVAPPDSKARIPRLWPDVMQPG